MKKYILSVFFISFFSFIGYSQDSDGDGISDANEAILGTDPFDDDTDDDGLLDGFEDANQNGIIEAGELNPTRFDTDGDGLSDGLELGLSAPQGSGTTGFVADADAGATTTDPLNPDTDFGGVIDGDEDLNRNGVVDSGVGETDPNNGADDGTLSLIKKDFRKEIKISKNPISNNLNIMLNKQYEFVEVRVSNILGQTIKTFREKNVRNLNFKVSKEPGIYFVDLLTNQGQKAMLKIIKK